MSFALPNLPLVDVITNLGAASVLLPSFLLTLGSLWFAGQRLAASVWLMAFSLAVGIILASKILFLGWGIGVAPINFTGASGHALFAASVLPVLFGWLLGSGHQRYGITGVGLGVLISIAVAISRVVVNAHSVSEALVGWLVGLAVSAVTLNAMRNLKPAPWFAWSALYVLFFALSTTLSNYLPTSNWEVRIALLLSGREQHFMR